MKICVVMFKLGLLFAILTTLGLAGYKWLAPSIMDKKSLQC
ncbi:unnamed protein product [Arabidopsis lyrata]|nr:unnamed protein product [Arabidopsis lyrata]